MKLLRTFIIVFLLAPFTGCLSNTSDTSKEDKVNSYIVYTNARIMIKELSNNLNDLEKLVANYKGKTHPLRRVIMGYNKSMRHKCNQSLQKTSYIMLGVEKPENKANKLTFNLYTQNTSFLEDFRIRCEAANIIMNKDQSTKDLKDAALIEIKKMREYLSTYHSVLVENRIEVPSRPKEGLEKDWVGDDLISTDKGAKSPIIATQTRSMSYGDRIQKYGIKNYNIMVKTLKSSSFTPYPIIPSVYHKLYYVDSEALYFPVTKAEKAYFNSKWKSFGEQHKGVTKELIREEAQRIYSKIPIKNYL